MDVGAIVIEPFNEAQLNTVSYDITLGDWVARYKRNDAGLRFGIDTPEFALEKTWDGHWLEPGERVLGHTRERVGGRVSRRPHFKPYAATTELRATSTFARWGLTVCGDAGWGDVGFVNFWTLEITNHNPSRVFLPIGSVIGQIVFHAVPPPSGADYSEAGNYNSGEEWDPRDMLPKKGKVRR